MSNSLENGEPAKMKNTEVLTLSTPFNSLLLKRVCSIFLYVKLMHQLYLWQFTSFNHLHAYLHSDMGLYPDSSSSGAHPDSDSSLIIDFFPIVVNNNIVHIFVFMSFSLVPILYELKYIHMKKCLSNNCTNKDTSLKPTYIN